MQEGMNKFVEQQKEKEKLLRQMLSEFNDGRSKTFYCIAATMLEIDELELALKQAREKSMGLDPKQKAEVMHSLLDKVAESKHYLLKLRKWIYRLLHWRISSVYNFITKNHFSDGC